VQTRRLHESFEGSYSSLASSSAEVSWATVDASGRLMHFLQFSDFGGKMGCLGHNFGSRHARRSSKGSINAGDHLVFKNSLRQNFGPWDWRPGPVKIGQKTESAPTLLASPRRTPHPNQNIFFNRTKKSSRICRGFEQLSSYCGWRVITKKPSANILALVGVKGWAIYLGVKGR